MTYELRIDYADGFEVVRVVADSIVSALTQTAAIAVTSQSIRVLGTIDKPQRFLAW